MTIQLCNSGGSGYYDLPVRSYSTIRQGHYLPTKFDYSDRFQQHVRRWRFDTMFTSSVEKAISHPSFREIVSMGEKVVPLIISEISSRPDMLMIALQLITGENPVQDRHRGQMTEMASDWIDWYRRKG